MDEASPDATVHSVVPHFKTPEGKARALANLAPPWKKGVSPNPGGLPGRSKRRPSGARMTPAFLKAALLKEVRYGKRYKALMQAWVSSALNGNMKALQLLLPYILPLEQDGQQGKVVFEGIKLELSSQDGRTALSMTQGKATLGEGEAGEEEEGEVSPSPPPRDVEPEPEG